MLKSRLEQDLKDNIEGQVRFDAISKRVYSVDASIYEIEPIGIVLPKHKQDLVKAVKIANFHNVPIIARGAATGIAGGCIGKGLIIDTTKFLNHILEINYVDEYAICEPGVVQDQLNNALAERGYRLGPDTSTGNRATLGGMLGNNAAGARSLHYGSMVDHVLGVELLLATGEIIYFEPVDEVTWARKRQLQDAEGRIYREIYAIREKYAEEIEKRFPKIPRRVSGYNLDELIKAKSASQPFNICKLIVGSEGTLGIATRIKVRLAKRPRKAGLSIIHFADMFQGMAAVPFLKSFCPLSLEMIDSKIIQLGRSSPSMKNKLNWLQGDPEALFIAEFEAATTEELLEKMNNFEKAIKQHSIGYSYTRVTEKKEMDHVWELRKSGLGLLLSRRTYSRAIAFLEDIAVGPENLASFMKQFKDCLAKHGKEAGIYGHVGAGCMHVRPFIDLRQTEEIANVKSLMNEVSTLLLEHGGTLSGEHGDGIVRSWLNSKMFGEKIYQAFVQLKSAFDPANRMNPGKIVHPLNPIENLRISPETKIQKIDTFMDFSHEGGFELAADLCNGNGQCRKMEGVMCPSFQASGEEYHTTRARAQALRGIINGKMPLTDFTSKGMYDVMDLCIECKGCKTECPSQVDMAKMKAEFLFHYHSKHGYPLRSKLFANIGFINSLTSPIAKAFNVLGKTWLVKQLLSWIGISTRRTLPPLAHERFSVWFSKHPQQPQQPQQKKVVLFNDTYNEFNHPEIGQAAVKVLNALGYEVIVPKWECCGRPAISKGMLVKAKEQASKLIDSLHPYVKQGLMIVGLEPSCILTMRDDYGGLLGNDKQKAQEVSAACVTFDQFLQDLLQKGELKFKISSPLDVKVHTHCYQKASIGSSSLVEVLKAVTGLQVTEIDSGCCGMAGSFGYEKEHYDFSMKIGGQRLFPAIKACAPGTIVVANGISCRSQILQGTSIKAQHIAQILAQFC